MTEGPDTEEINPGDIVIDLEEEAEDNEPRTKMVVVNLSDETADEYVFTWDSSMNPITVAEVNDDKYSSDRVVEVVYLNKIESRFPELDVDNIERIRELLSESKLREYAYPRDRLSLVEHK